MMFFDRKTCIEIDLNNGIWLSDFIDSLQKQGVPAPFPDIMLSQLQSIKAAGYVVEAPQGFYFSPKKLTLLKTILGPYGLALVSVDTPEFNPYSSLSQGS
jgi:hypothetical protein